MADLDGIATPYGHDDTSWDRLAAVSCWAPGAANCRHEWNQRHPESPVTKQEQAAFEAGVTRRWVREGGDQ